jgi:hypothetical protein
VLGRLDVSLPSVELKFASTTATLDLAIWKSDRFRAECFYSLSMSCASDVLTVVVEGLEVSFASRAEREVVVVAAIVFVGAFAVGNELTTRRSHTADCETQKKECIVSRGTREIGKGAVHWRKFVERRDYTIPPTPLSYHPECLGRFQHTIHPFIAWRVGMLSDKGGRKREADETGGALFAYCR